MASRRRNHAHGMSLITVLVITAIVATLSAVLFPVIVGHPPADTSSALHSYSTPASLSLTRTGFQA
jgi:type II secretory pathway pseudopilin PulG